MAEYINLNIQEKHPHISVPLHLFVKIFWKIKRKEKSGPRST